MSKKEQYYRQCTYERPTENGKAMDTAWLPEHLAQVGKQFVIKARPEYTYTVTSVGSRRTISYLKGKEQTNRKYGQSAGLNCD